jgi:uncharacterized tellurite resistance protein B-like protein
LAEDAGREARRAARRRELEARRSRAAAERQARAFARLAREEEREEAQARAAGEHAENEELLREIRDVLELAPRRLRRRKEHEEGLAARPFPPPGRETADRARLESSVDARLRSWTPPAEPWPILAGALGAVGVLAGLGLAFVRPALGGAAAVAAGAIAFAAWLWRRRSLWARRAEEAARARAEIAATIAGELERDRTAHEASESERLRRLRGVLEGDAELSAEAFLAAAAALDLPLGASAAFSTLGPGFGELDIDLHAENEIPRQRSTLLKTGRISYRNRAQKEVREDDARAIAALALLYTVLAFDALPALETLIVSAFREGIDPATGHDAEVCLVSFAVDRAEIAALNLERLDPLATVRAFEGRFSMTAGFQLKAVEPLKPEDLAAPEEDGAPPVAIVHGEGARRAAAPAAAPVSRRGRAAAAEKSEDASFEIARHVLALAMACARADGAVDAAESRAISSAIESHYALSRTASKRLALERAALAESAIDVEAPAKALRSLLSPLERQLALERIVGAAAGDGRVDVGEVALLECIGLTLDLPPTFILDLLKRWTLPASASEPEGARRQRWLAALELPADSTLDRAAVERAGRRILDIYAEHRFELVAPELKDMAARRRELAREAVEGLLSGIPAPPPEPAAADDERAVRRDNPDLDSIFGS